jgi:cysteine sulfinate desulfinase/cysteine desulfurase-like protein
MNGSTVALLIVTTTNLAATLGIAYAAVKGKQQVEQEVADLKTKTNKTVSKLKAALEDLEV